MTDNAALLRDVTAGLDGEDLRGVAFDRWRIRDVEQVCLDSGVPTSVMVARGSGAGDKADGSFSIRAAQSLFRRGLVRALPSRLMLHELSGAVVRRDMNHNPALKRYDTRRSIIDGVSAMVHALGLSEADRVARTKRKTSSGLLVA